MKLSDAILKGCEMRPAQAFGVFFDEATQGSCVFGAAYEGVAGSLGKVGVGMPLMNVAEYMDAVVLIDREAACPECGFDSIVYEVAATHLNDLHRWSRERIAAWIATVEEAKDA